MSFACSPLLTDFASHAVQGAVLAIWFYETAYRLKSLRTFAVCPLQVLKLDNGHISTIGHIEPDHVTCVRKCDHPHLWCINNSQQQQQLQTS